MKRTAINLLSMVAVFSMLLTSAAVAAPTGSIPAAGQTLAAQPKDAAQLAGDPDLAAPPPPHKPQPGELEKEGDPLDRDYAFYSRRTAGDPNVGFTLAQAAVLRAQAASAVAGTNRSAPSAPGTFGGAWTAAGPDPIVLTGRGDASFDAMAGRIGALAIRSSAPYTIYLGGAQGGVWISSTLTGAWTAKTDQLP
jgi:hypothetical protein